ncbi:hypothetical protein Q5762_29685 [Streptomyces sp. P9(2023)]|uniref:hypothetical protein n=1 Tax=Streptomyces sp. P9(2023) TaxID=3064394 RepID=UPI0028F41F53|nr:hypothetical protein [Streptomyces sp. P9(2023)]MDT9692430.1 hypothetical protein [Streptomyces sp. P9(2023)]
MRNPIVCVLMWLLILALPPTGRHRPRQATQRHRHTPRQAAPAPTWRSPYAREQAMLLDGAGSPLERPYLTAAARVQRRRRRALWLATVGVDVDHRNIHARVAR